MQSQESRTFTPLRSLSLSLALSLYFSVLAILNQLQKPPITFIPTTPSVTWSLPSITPIPQFCRKIPQPQVPTLPERDGNSAFLQRTLGFFETVKPSIVHRKQGGASLQKRSGSWSGVIKISGPTTWLHYDSNQQWNMIQPIELSSFSPFASFWKACRCKIINMPPQWPPTQLSSFANGINVVAGVPESIVRGSMLWSSQKQCVQNKQHGSAFLHHVDDQTVIFQGVLWIFDDRLGEASVVKHPTPVPLRDAIISKSYIILY